MRIIRVCHKKTCENLIPTGTTGLRSLGEMGKDAISPRHLRGALFFTSFSRFGLTQLSKQHSHLPKHFGVYGADGMNLLDLL